MGSATRYVAFLRAINLGSTRKVSMARLKEEFEALGLDDVTTYINSGNVLFSATGKAAELERQIEAHLEDRLGFAVETFVRTAPEVRKLAAADPFPRRADGDTHFVAFLRAKPTAAVKKAVESLSTEVDELRAVGRDVHWRISGGFMASKVNAKALDRALGGPNTTRNTTMLRKLVAKLD